MFVRLLLAVALLVPTLALAAEEDGHGRTSYLFYDGNNGSQVGPFKNKEDCDKAVEKLRQGQLKADKIVDCWPTDASFVVVYGPWHTRFHRRSQ